MKMRLSRVIMILATVAASNVQAATPWSNCPSTYANSVQEIFRKMDVNGGTGPDYQLPSGHILSNSAALCQRGAIFKADDWAKVLKTSISPAKSVTVFKTVTTPLEFQKFLNDLGIKTSGSLRVDEVIKAYLAGHPLPSESVNQTESAPNPVIMVGANKNQALIALATSDGQTRSITLMALNRQ